MMHLCFRPTRTGRTLRIDRLYICIFYLCTNVYVDYIYVHYIYVFYIYAHTGQIFGWRFLLRICAPY